MPSMINSLVIQRAAPFLARILSVINIAMIVLSLVLFTLVWSIQAAHTDSETLGELQYANTLVSGALVSAEYKQLLDSRLWRIKPELGGGVIITTNNGLIKNKLSTQHLTVYLTSQSILKCFTALCILAVILLLASRNYLRLVALSAINILLIFHFKTPFLFDEKTAITTPVSYAITSLTFVALILWIYNKWLLKNNHVSSTLIAYASQSGSAMSLAKRFNKALLHTSDVRCVSTLDPNIFSQYENVLLIASTYGEGQPPEKAQNFLRKLTSLNTYESAVNFSILALGDRHYSDFCAFGHRLEQLLTLKGAQSIVHTVEVDRLDNNSVNDWWQKLTTQLNWRTKDIKQACVSLPVVENTVCNPTQGHRHAHVIAFDKQQLSYQPGDLLAISPVRSTKHAKRIIDSLGLQAQDTVTLAKQKTTLLNALTTLEWQGEQAETAQQLVEKLRPLVPRVYSIASSPYHDTIELLVRRHTLENGEPGIASHYLCDLTPEQLVNAEIRVHSNFHLPKHDAPLILIGAGTGLAPLIGFLRHRAATVSSQQHWLLFGEQYQAKDFYFSKEIDLLCQQKLISKLSLAWSRDNEPSYIGEHITREKAQLLEWVQELGANIYVCGNQVGFGESVCEKLTEIFGQKAYQRMIQHGQLRTDLY